MIPLGILASSVRRASAALLAPTNLVATLVEPPLTDPYWDNVVALLHFDDETDPWEDATGKIWEPVGIVEHDLGKWGDSAGSFVDSNDRYLRSPNTDGIFNLPGQFTFECWFQHSNSGSPYRNIFLGGSSSTPGGFAVTVAHKASIDVSEMYGANVLSAPFEVGDAWYHLAVTRHSDNIVRLFLNGVLLSQTISTSSFTFSTTGYAHILNHPQGSGSVGRVDELRITKGVARYTENFTPPTEPFPNFGPPPEPTAPDPYWDNVVSLSHFDELVGGEFVDETGATLVSMGAVPTVDTSNKLYGAGSGQFAPSTSVEIRGIPVAAGEDFCVEFNYYVTPSSGSKGLMSTLDGVILRDYIYLSGNNLNVGGTNFPLVVDTWVHIAWLRISGRNKCYIDGVMKKDRADTHLYDSGMTLHIGSDDNVVGPSSAPLGRFEELRITKGIARYTENFTPPTEPFPNFGPPPGPTPTLPTVLGEPYGGGFYAGDIEYPDGQWYKLIVADVSADITGANSRWKTTNTDTPGASHSIDGVANTTAMIAAGIELHPAAQHCIDHRGGGSADWYMPAKDELNVIYQNLGYARPNCPPDFLSGGSQAFSGNWYWASSEWSSTGSWIQHFGNGSQSFGVQKTDATCQVRPVRRIPFTPEVPDLPTIIGEEFGGGYYIGDITIADGGADDGTYAVIMAGLEGEAPTTLRWKISNTATSGTDSLTDGLTNTLAMEIAELEAHPAASYCLSYAGGGNVDWYLPAIDELGLVWTNMPLLSTLEISPQRYWSSSEQTFNLANLWYFLNGIQEGGLKANPYYVRPVRRIKRS